VRFLRWLKPARRTWRFDRDVGDPFFARVEQQIREAYASICKVAPLYTDGRRVDARELVWSKDGRTNLNDMEWTNMPAGEISGVVCFDDRGLVVKVQQLICPMRLKKGWNFAIPAGCLVVTVDIS